MTMSSNPTKINNAAIIESVLEDVEKFITSNDGNNNVIGQLKSMWKKKLQGHQKSNKQLPKKKQIQQLDGVNDTSTEDDFDSSESATTQKESTMADTNIDEDPINSNDDLSEDEDMMTTDNIIMCQYQKVSKRFNKWRIYLKDGIMHINGKDYTFSTMVGEAKW